MPIVFNKENQTWVAENLNDDEKESLLSIAREFIIASFGQEVAERIFQGMVQREALNEIPVEDLHSA